MLFMISEPNDQYDHSICPKSNFASDEEIANLIHQEIVRLNDDTTPQSISSGIHETEMKELHLILWDMKHLADEACIITDVELTEFGTRIIFKFSTNEAWDWEYLETGSLAVCAADHSRIERVKLRLIREISLKKAKKEKGERELIAQGILDTLSIVERSALREFKHLLNNL